MQTVKWTAFLLLILFSGYTIYAARTESFWKSAQKVFALKWGRQVTVDLYLGLLLFNFFIYLNEGSLLIALAWLLPTLILGNIVPLLYFVIHFDALLGRFIS